MERDALVAQACPKEGNAALPPVGDPSKKRMENYPSGTMGAFGNFDEGVSV